MKMKVQFFWSVESFHTLSIMPGESLLSPIFYVESSKAAEFCLRLHGMGFPSSSQNHVANLFLCRCDKDGPENIEIVYTLRTQKEEIRSIYKRRFLKPQQDALYESNETNALPVRTFDILSNELTVICTILQYADDRYASSDMNNKDDFEDLSRAFTDMFHSSLYSDGVIRIQNHEFEIHKAVFDVRCPALLKECRSRNRRIVSPKCDDPGIQMLLYYIYSGKFKSNDVPDELYFLLKKCNDSIFDHLFTAFPTSMHIHTSFEVHEIRIVWHIKNFIYYKESKEYFCKITEGHPSTWFKITFFTFQLGDETERFQLEMHKMCKESTLFVQCDINIYGCKPIRISIFKGSHLFIDENPWKVELDHALRDIRESQRGPTTKFTIEIKVTDGKPTHSVKRVLLSSNPDSSLNITEKQYELGRDLGKLYKNPMHSDVTLNINGKRIPAHKAILSARSPHFRKRLEDDTNQMKEGELPIDDLDEKVALCMIYYIYSAQVFDFDIDFAYEMHKAATKYQISQLKRKCTIFLKYSLTAANVCEMLLFADTEEDHELKGFVFSFITLNPGSVLESKESIGLLKSYPYLCVDVLRKIYAYLHENV